MVTLAFYKGTRPGVSGIYNRGVRWWTESLYSHVEVVFSDGTCGSASFEDGGVRLKRISFDHTKWDFVELPHVDHQKAYEWFVQHDGEKYDVLGNVHFVISPVKDSRNKKFCSEAAAASIGIPNPERFDPGTLYAVAVWMAEQNQQ